MDSCDPADLEEMPVESRWFAPGELDDADASELPMGACPGCGYEDSESDGPTDGYEDWPMADLVARVRALDTEVEVMRIEIIKLEDELAGRVLEHLGAGR